MQSANLRWVAALLVAAPVSAAPAAKAPAKPASMPAAVKPASPAPVVSVTVSPANPVVSVLSKSGCNMGACHGAAAGKNGFRLTLRGYDPELDYERLLHESGGRRIQRFNPGDSLLLKKAVLAVPHAGGMRFKEGS